MLRDAGMAYIQLFLSPYVLILLILLFVDYLRNVKTARIQEMVLGESEHSPLALTLYQGMVGMAAGFLLTLLAAGFQIGFESYMPLQVMLLLTLTAVMGLPMYAHLGITIPVVLLSMGLFGSEQVSFTDLRSAYLLLGLMLLVQGAVTALDHAHGTIPFLAKTEERVMGAFRITRFYLFPMVLGFHPVSGPILGAVVVFSAAFSAFSVNQVFLTFDKRTGALVLGGMKAGTGLLILLGSAAAGAYPPILYGVMAFAFALLTGEGFIFRWLEERRQPVFQSAPSKVAVLEVRRDTPAYAGGLRSGDRILSLDGMEGPGFPELVESIARSPVRRQVELVVEDTNQREKHVAFRVTPGESTGVLIVPDALRIEEASKDNRQS